MKTKLVAVLLSVLFLVPLFAFPADAAVFEVKGLDASDYVVYAPGVFDLLVTTDAVQPRYQWYAQVGTSSDASKIKLENNDAYSGVNTDHLKLIARDGMEESWQEISFFCAVTDKDGNTRCGPNFVMTIRDHQRILTALSNNGIGITQARVTNSVASRKVNGVSYFDCYLNQGINFSFSHQQLPNGNFKNWFAASEAELREEFIVTEDGKSTLYTSLSHYDPKKTGAAAVRVTANLILYMNGARMETIDTKTIAVNVIEPEGMGFGYTNSNCAVLEGQYSQAKVIERLEKGRAVHLIADTGSYYQVIVNGSLGYLPKTAVNVPEKIPYVAIDSIAEPSEYANPDFSPVLLDPDLYELYRTDPVTWYDKTSNRFLAANDTFLPGHTYSLSVWLKAKTGHSFPVLNGKPNVSVTINQRAAAAVTAYEQDPEEVIELQYTFTHVHNPQKVAQKNPTCTTPGKAVYYRCGCGMAYEDHQAKKVISDPNWGEMPALGHWESGWKSNGASHYKVCQRRECAQVIEGTTEAHRGGIATCTSGAFCSVCGLEYGKKAAHSWTKSWDYITAEGHAHACKYICGTIGPLQKHVPGPAATASSPQTCKECGYILAPAVNHTHSLTKVDEKQPTCMDPGNSAYYTCSGCNELFKDAAGKQPLSSLDEVTLAPLGHRISDEWHFSDAQHWRVCTRCGIAMEETMADHELDEKGVCLTCGFDREDPALVTEDPTVPLPVQPTEPNAPLPSSGKPEGENGQEEKPAAPHENDGGIPWWGIVLAAVAPALVAVLTALAVKYAGKKKEKTETKSKSEE